ncbi:BTG3 protein, partial [Amia calva]|nr:BTG3 protein [Amia calva]
MKKEIASAVLFLSKLMRKVEKKKVEEFAEQLTTALQEKFRGHWYPDNPVKGQAYRYGKDNDTFKVESFPSSGDDNIEDITKEVTSATEKVTSDYNSAPPRMKRAAPGIPSRPPPATPSAQCTRY